MTQVELIFRNQEIKPDLEPLCTAVMKHFSLPSTSVACIFDDTERADFAGVFGDYFCGFFCPVSKYGLRTAPWPNELISHFSDVSKGIAFTHKNVIYIRKKVCERRTGATITFAHELQHYMQYAFCFRDWQTNTWIGEVLTEEHNHPAPWDLPCEYEAQLISKRVSQAILGPEEIDRYSTEQIRLGNDPRKWTFFRQLDISERYNFPDATRSIGHLNKEKLQALYLKYGRPSREPDFTRDDWWI